MMKAITLNETPPKLDGTTIVRIVLSALAETIIVADGLNLSAVGGNECTCKILRRGWGQLKRTKAAYRKGFGVKQPDREVGSSERDQSVLANIQHGDGLASDIPLQRQVPLVLRRVLLVSVLARKLARLVPRDVRLALSLLLSAFRQHRVKDSEDGEVVIVRCRCRARGEEAGGAELDLRVVDHRGVDRLRDLQSRHKILLPSLELVNRKFRRRCDGKLSKVS